MAMYDFYYTKLLRDASKFEPRAGNRCVDVLEPDVCRCLTTVPETVS